ncbi:hypothetical protein [Pseudoalteromonas mariniglutinosa]|uniref:hypothetical protein n=1 Tax=Pseudoalteromonas mariniglutinosa TaxID=206042 RepID=UPI00384D2DBB
MNKLLRVVVTVCTTIPILGVAKTTGLLSVAAVQGDELLSFQRAGVGLYRYDNQHDGIMLSQALLSNRIELTTNWSAHSVLNIQQDKDVKIGFSQAYAQYQPLTKNHYKWTLKAGGFYPQMSLENPELGWTSPYNYSHSAINTWLAEELRTVGVEASVKRLGNRVRSAHSFNWFAAVFKGNDPAGTLLAWRGFAIHQRQTTFNERVRFARPVSFATLQLSKQSDYVLPFEEVDGRFGYYLGMHWDYYKQSQFRVYYYDNNGDPGALNVDTGQYAWDTRFLSVAWLYKFDKQTRFIMQLLGGKTAMGQQRGINNDFYSHFALFSHQIKQHRFTVRYDYFTVRDKDDWQFDPNQSNGESVTASWRYNLSEQWQLGAEISWLKSDAAHRQPIGFNQVMSQQQLMLVAQWRF